MSCGVARGVMKGHRQWPRCCSPDARPGRASGAREGCPVTGTWGGHGKQTPQQDRSRGQRGRTPESRARPRPGAPGAQRHAWVAGAPAWASAGPRGEGPSRLGPAPGWPSSPHPVRVQMSPSARTPVVDSGLHLDLSSLQSPDFREATRLGEGGGGELGCPWLFLGGVIQATAEDSLPALAVTAGSSTGQPHQKPGAEPGGGEVPRVPQTLANLPDTPER